jgi:hypothetical protein
VDFLLAHGAIVIRPAWAMPFRRRGRVVPLHRSQRQSMRAICSTLIAQAFQSVRYPILPRIQKPVEAHLSQGAREVLHVRHYSLFTPRDFDISPYFQILKPEVECGFDYRALLWASGSSQTEVPGDGDAIRDSALSTREVAAARALASTHPRRTC